MPAEPAPSTPWPPEGGAPEAVSGVHEARDEGPRDGLWVFGALWAPAWKALRRQLSSELEAGLIREVDINDRPELADRFAIRSVPTFLVLSEGRELQRIVGAVDPDRLRRLAGS